MTLRPSVVRLWLVLFLIVGCALAAGRHAVAQPSVGKPSALELTPCRQPGLATAVRCGQIPRLLNPSDPRSPTISIHFVVLPAITRHQNNDPLFILAGGPGQSAIDLASNIALLYRRLNLERDIVLVDQRGTGRSAPLSCRQPARQRLAEQALAPQRQHLLRCLDTLSRQAPWRSAQGLRWFGTTLAVQDMNAVRKHLGFAQVNLIGASYGTRVGLEWLRLYPGTVRRAVLDGVVPPDMALPQSSGPDGEAAFEALLAACEADSVCNQRKPPLRQLWADLWASLPRSITVAHPLDGQRETLTLTPDLLAAWVRAPLYVPTLSSALPAALRAAQEGHWESLLGLSAAVSSQQSTGSGFAVGMHFSVICAEDPLAAHPTAFAPASAASSASLGWSDSARQLYMQVCAQWPRGPVAPNFVNIPPARSPVLLLSGGIDPITPPRHAQRVSEALGAMALHAVVPQAGHGVMGLGCINQLITEFIRTPLDNQALVLNTSCAQAIPRPPMFDLPLREGTSS